MSNNIDRNIEHIINNTNTINSNLNNINNSLNTLVNIQLLNNLTNIPPPPPRVQRSRPNTLYRNPLFSDIIFPRTNSQSQQSPSSTQPLHYTQSPLRGQSPLSSQSHLSAPPPTTSNNSSNILPNVPEESSLSSIPDNVTSLFSSLMNGRNGLGSMEISVMGLQPSTSTNIEPENNLVISHHNISINTKVYAKHYLENEEKDKCAICLADIEENEIIREVKKCKHYLHLNCADKWFEENIKCPICRVDIRTELQ